MVVDDLAHDREPETGPSVVARPRFIKTRESFEHKASIGLGDAVAVIGHSELNRFVSGCAHGAAEVHPSPRMTGGVVGEVPNETLQVRPIAQHLHRLDPREVDGHIRG